MDASDRLHELQEQRDAAGARVGQLEDGHRRAVAAQREASAALSEAERVALAPAKLRALEDALTKARSVAAEPWAERITGAQAAVRDADRLLREHVAANLGELVATIEVEGEAAAAQVDEAAAALVAAFQHREALASQLGALITFVNRPSPGDVSFSRADELGRAAQTFLAEGGEEPVSLTRDGAPWATLLGTAEVEAEAEPVSA